MARRVVVQVNCDICGEEVSSDAATEFSFGARAYRADLCASHRGELGSALKPFIDVAEVLARRTAPPPVPGRAEAPIRPRAARRDAEQVGAIRTWARANGFEVSTRGRIPQAVEDAYNMRGRG
ncbi:MAG TPA: Lsr2 family protein [Acidimicrobiales bacterium]|nr:Lsr2 family protein [Acidimicrobiales bacterium]